MNEQYVKTQAFAIYSNSIYVENETVLVGPSEKPKLDIIKDKRYRKEPLYYQRLRSFRS